MADGGYDNADDGGGWEYEAEWDDRSEAVYYVSFATGESTWERSVTRKAPARPSARPPRRASLQVASRASARH